MDLVIYVFGTAILALGLLLAFRRFWVMKVKPDRIQGSDLHMLKYCIEENTRAWGAMHLIFKEDADFDVAASEVHENIRRHMETPESTFQLGVDLEKKQYLRHDDLTVDDIVDVVHDEASLYSMNDNEKFREFVFRICHEKRLMSLLFDHTVWDGVRLVNEIVVPTIESRPFGSRWLMNDKYIPVLAEIMQIYTIFMMGFRWLTYRPMKTFDNEGDQVVVSHRFDLSTIRDAKNRNHVKFTSALLGVWMQKLFEALDESQQMVRVGVLVGMVNPRFRNNYTIVTVDVRREPDLDRMVRAIERQLNIRKFEVIPLYHMISCIEAQTLFKKHAIDYLFSPGFFHSNKGVSKMIDDMSFCAIPVGMPFYTFACSIDDFVTISTTVNTPKCDVKKLASDATRLYTYRTEEYLVREK